MKTLADMFDRMADRLDEEAAERDRKEADDKARIARDHAAQVAQKDAEIARLNSTIARRNEQLGAERHRREVEVGDLKADILERDVMLAQVTEEKNKALQQATFWLQRARQLSVEVSNAKAATSTLLVGGLAYAGFKAFLDPGPRRRRR